MVGVVSLVPLVALVLGLTVQLPPADSPDFVPLLGLWRAGIEDGRPTFTIDGTAGVPKASDDGAKAVFGADAGRFTVAAAGAATLFPLAVAKNVQAFSGGQLRVDFKILAGATDQTAGVAFNLRPDGSYLYARYNTKDGNVAIWKFADGVRTVLAHGELHEQLPFGVWHTLVVSVEGRLVTAVVNDKLRVAHTLDVAVAGRAGLWTKADSVTAFRGFAVNPPVR